MSTIDQLRTRIGRNIRHQRMRLNLTQGEVAQRTKLGTWRVISEIERGKREVMSGELKDIGRALSCCWYDFLNPPTHDLVNVRIVEGWIAA